jgi:hypothetical protein
MSQSNSNVVPPHVGSGIPPIPPIPPCHGDVDYVDLSHTHGPTPSTPMVFTGNTKSMVDKAKSIHLSPSYTLFDACRIPHIPVHGVIQAENLAWAMWAQPQLTKLFTTLIEPLSHHYSTPVAVVGAMRWAARPTHASPWEGWDVETRSIYGRRGYGGPSTHALGLGADIVIPNIDHSQALDWIVRHSPCPWGVVGLECVGGTGLASWLHVSIPHVHPRSKKLVYGVVNELSVDSMNRPRSRRKAHLAQPKLDRWPLAQSWEQWQCGNRGAHPHG